jgi:hypothetical protein
LLLTLLISAHAREPQENQGRIATSRRGCSKKGNEKKEKACKENKPSQPEIEVALTAPEEQPTNVMPYPIQAHLVGASSSNPSHPTDNDNTEEILSHASQVHAQ